MPSEPVSDYFTYSIINTFYWASRGRSYVSGMAVKPLPLGVADITNTLNAHPVLLEREIIDSCVFAIDDIFLKDLQQDNNKEVDNTT